MRWPIFFAASIALNLAQPIAAASERSTALIIDASGSMKAKLADGQTRMDAAKDALATLVTGLPDEQRLALWAYGHQSPTKKRNCRDTQQLTVFKPIGENRSSSWRVTSTRRATRRSRSSSSRRPAV